MSMLDSVVLNNQGYHLDSNVGYYMSGRNMGPNERQEEFRAQMIDMEVRERQRIERRNLKEYGDD